MNEGPYGFDTGRLVIGLIKLLKDRGVLEENVVLDLLWDVKDPHFPWTKSDIKELLKL